MESRIILKTSEPQITLDNMYIPPKENNSDPVISTFIDELSSIIQTLSTENLETILVGDFNIDLLKVNEKIKYYLFHTNGFYPKITLPTRFSSRSCSLIDQLYCKLSTTTNTATAGIIVVVVVEIFYLQHNIS